MNDQRQRQRHYLSGDRTHRGCLGKLKYPSKKNAAATARAKASRDGDRRWNCYR